MRGHVNVRPPRSYLYVPADQPAKLSGAAGRGADALIIDLEDAVPTHRKDAAREAVLRWVREPRPAIQVWVRINAGAERDADLRALRDLPGLDGLCLAKTRSAAEVSEIDELLNSSGSSVGLVPVLETARAVLDAAEIARVPRVRRLQLGEVDLRADLGLPADADDSALLWARSVVVFASAAAGCDQPIAAVSTDFTDLEALRVSTSKFAQLGFFGRGCIHPAQLSVVNTAFTPTEEQIERARTLIATLAASGGAATLGANGNMIDEAVVRSARRTLAWADGD